MRKNVEMRFGEWFVRLSCKLLALGAGILGAGGFAIVGIRAVLPMIDDGRYVEAACAGIASVAALYGLTPLALAVEKSLLSLAGMAPLTSDEHQAR